MAEDLEPPLPLPPGLRWEGPVPVPEFLPRLSDASGGSHDRIDALRANETCPICRRLLDGIDRLEGRRREQALDEYERFKAAMEGEHATEADIKRVFETSPMLEHVLIDKLGVEELGLEIGGE